VIDVRLYRKKPNVVAAVEVPTDRSDPEYPRRCVEVAEWCGGVSDMMNADGADNRIRISTLEGDMLARPGDYIIRGIAGEFYPHKADFFFDSYAPMDDNYRNYSSDPQLFTLERDVDVSHVSGTGTVADGVLWPTGMVAICWRGECSSVSVWQSLDDAMKIHGHNGNTRAVFA
jgi:hypothetical protein